MTSIDRDERTVAVENASYRWGHQFLVFGVLVLAVWRSLVLNEASWDLMGLVILGGLVPAAYQASQHVLTARWAKRQVFAMITAAIVAALVALAKGWR